MIHICDQFKATLDQERYSYHQQQGGVADDVYLESLQLAYCNWHNAKMILDHLMKEAIYE